MIKASRSMFWSLVALCLVSTSSGAAEPELPQFAPHKHMGVATCGNSTCHSVTQLEVPSNVLQNEYATWLFHDGHSKAYATLLSDESKQIATKLGLKDAATADICLDCHSDNVPVERRLSLIHI